MSERRYWIGVIARDHVEHAVAQGFAQIGHGRAGPLRRLQAGDGLAFYSPRTAFPAGEPLQVFTAIGCVAEGPIFEAIGPEQAHVFRRHMTYFDATAAPIRPLLERLTFIRDKSHWGAALRSGLVRVPREDFAAIATAMGRDPDVDFG